MVAFPNPEPRFIEKREHLGTLWDAARAAKVKPTTIRVWVSRLKIEPVDLADGGPELFHLPTVARAADARAKYTPSDPAANRRGAGIQQAA